MKRLLEAFKKVAGRKAGECPDCGGRGHIIHGGGAGPCPTCARLREIAEWCWHEFKSTEGGTWTGPCVKCGKDWSTVDMSEYPAFTIQSIRQLMEDLGEWEGFIEWHDTNIYECGTFITLRGIEEATWDDDMFAIKRESSADILTSDTKLAEACAEYLEAQHGA